MRQSAVEASGGGDGRSGGGPGGSARETRYLVHRSISPVGRACNARPMAEPDPSPTAMRDWGLAAPGELDRIVIVSPHLDDSVLRCSYLMAAHPGVTVITVFAGRPAAY